MATRLIGTDSANPRLPALVIGATQGTTHDDLAPGDLPATKAAEALDTANAYTDTKLTEAKAYTDSELAAAMLDPDLVTFADEAETIAGIFTNKAVSPAGLQAAQPAIDVRSFGAVGDGVADDAPAVRAAAAVAETSGRDLLLPAGTYRFRTFGADQSFVPLTTGITIRGVPGQTTVLIDQTTTGWRTVFGSIPWQNHDLSGLCVEDIIFDGQSDVNPINAANAASQRYAVTAYKGRDMRVRNCVFRDWDGRNIVAFISNVVTPTDIVTDIHIHGNTFDNIGGAYWHDHSAVYASGPDVHIYANSFRGVATPASSAWTAIEVHGHRVHIHDNTFANYASPCLISPVVPAIPEAPASLFHYHDNSAYNCGAGVTLRPQLEMAGVLIHDNNFEISIDQWPAAAAAPYPGTVAHAGVFMYGQATRIQRMRIHDNSCRWLPRTTAASPRDCFVTWMRELRIAGDLADVDIAIVNNDIVDCPSAGIHVENFASLADWDVSGNRFVNIGKAGLGASLQAGMRIGYQAWTGTRPVGVQDLRFNANKFIDDQATHTLVTPLSSPAGTARVDPGCATTNASTTVTDPAAKVLDIGSLITGTNIPAGTFITQVTNATDGYAGDGYILSAAATATGSGLSFTITQQPPTFGNVEQFDTTLRVADGAAVPLNQLQAGQSVHVDQRSRFVYKSGDQSASDNVNLADVTELAFPIVAGAVYMFCFELFVVSAAATNGIALAVNGPAAPTYVRYQRLDAISGSAVNAGGSTTYNVALVDTAASAVNPLPCRITGHVANGVNAGTLTLRMRSEEAATAVTIQRGSWGELKRIA